MPLFDRTAGVLTAAIVVLMLCLTGCVGDSGSAVPDTGDAAPALDQPVNLPLPSTLKETAAATRGAFRYGDEYETAWPHRNAVPGSASTGVFSPDWRSSDSDAGLAYAIYRFDLNGYNHDALLNLEWASRRTDFSNLWVGLANFTTDTWDWFPGPEDGKLAIDEAQHLSSGELYVAVMCLGELPWELTSIGFGEDDGTWVHTWGGDGNEWAYCVTADPAGNVYAAGYTTTFGSPGTHVPVVKYNAAGELVWSKVIDGDSSTERIKSMVATDDALYLAGFTSVGPGLENCLLVKLDHDGALDWAKVWGADEGEALESLDLTPSGNIICAGATEGFPPSEWPIVTKVLLLEYAPDGSLVTSRKLHDGSVDDYGASGISVDTLGNAYICGSGPDIGIVAKLAPAGDLEYAMGWGDSVDTIFSNICVDSTGVNICGNYNFIDNAFIAKFDLITGSLLWAKSWGRGLDTRGKSIVSDGSGNLFMTGMTKAFSAAGYYDLLLLQYAADGTFIDAKTWGGIYDNGREQQGYGVFVDSSGNLYFSGCAVDNNGSWLDVTATDTAPTGTETPVALDLTSITGTDYIASEFQCTHQLGTQDTGGGGEDLLIMKTVNTYASSGTIEDGVGIPIGGVTVDITGDHTGFGLSDGAGAWVAYGLPSGSYTATPDRPGWTFVPDHIDFSVDNADAVALDFTGTAASGSYIISGMVDGGAALGLEGVKIRLTGAVETVAETDVAGFYSIGALPDGDYTVTPSKAGWSFQPAERSVTISGANVNVDPFMGTWEDWAHTLGGGFGLINNDAGQSVAVAPDGSVYTTGLTKVYGEGSFDVLTASYDAVGNFRWCKTWGESSTDVGDCVVVAGGKLFVIGTTYNFGEGGSDIIILEYSLDGTLLSQNTWGTANDDEPVAAAVDPAGNIYVAGMTEPAGNWLDILVLKLNPAGTPLWARSWGGTEMEEAFGIAADADGVFVTGHAMSFNEDNDKQLALLKFSADGDLTWDVSWIHDGEHWGKAVALDGAGGVFVAPHFNQDPEGMHGSPEIAVLKFDVVDGNLAWTSETWGGEGYDEAAGLFIDAQGNYLIAGTVESFFGEVPAVMLTSFNPDGTFSWAKAWGGHAESQCWGAGYADGAVYFAGMSENNAGAWYEVFGRVLPMDENSTATPGGTAVAVSGVTAVATGAESTPAPTQDTGGGGSDALVLRVSLD